MELLPKDLENMIIDYKHQLDHQGKLQSVLKDLVEYVPEKRKYIKYEFVNYYEVGDTLTLLQIWNLMCEEDLEETEHKKYVKDSRMSGDNNDVDYYGIFENNGKIWWEY